MRSRRSTFHVALLCLLGPLVMAPPGDALAQGSAAGAHPGLTGTAGAFGLGAAKRPISESEMDRYLAALEELVARGMGDQRALASARQSEAAMNVISSQGFDSKSFGEVHGNVMSAYLALEMKGRQAELEAARAEHDARMAEMKAKLPPEQYEAIARTMESMRSITRSAENVPPQNLALVEKHREQLDRILERPGRK